MAFRVVCVKNHCKLEHSLNYLIYKGEEIKKILIDEIEMLIIESPQVCITSSLMSELVKKKVKIMFCDEKHRPLFETVGYQNNSLSFKRIKEQINWKDNVKGEVRRLIIKTKLYYSALLLKKMNKIDEFNQLISYMDMVETHDSSSREGHGAKIYFHALFGKDFSRKDVDIKENKYLNFGYSIIASLISREIKYFGYLTELGIHHIGETNPFNLTYDFIEPLRAYIDSHVVLNKVDDDNYKKVFIKMVESIVIYEGKKMFLDNAIHLYVQKLFHCLNNENFGDLRFIEYEF